MAGPGPSGLRSSHLFAMRRLPQGPATLAAWAQVWAQAQIAPMLAQIWTDQVVRPFYKPSPDAESRRPIVCGEALLMFALGCFFKTARRQFADVFGEEQYGGGRCAGAPALARDVRAKCRLRPDRDVAQTDFKNAYGCVGWSDALGAALEHVPAVAPSLAAVWGDTDRGQRLCVESSPSTWVASTIFGAVMQGGQEGPPVFCLIVLIVVVLCAAACPVTFSGCSFLWTT